MRRWAHLAMPRILALLLLCGAALGQQQDAVKISVRGTPPAADSPLPSGKPGAAHGSIPEARSSVKTPLLRHHDTRLASAIAFNWAATTADVVTSLKGLDSSRCREANPLFGKHPSPGKVAGISYGYTAGYTLFALLVHRKHPESKAPWIGNLILGGGHAVAAAANARCF